MASNYRFAARQREDDPIALQHNDPLCQKPYMNIEITSFGVTKVPDTFDATFGRVDVP